MINKPLTSIKEKVRNQSKLNTLKKPALRMDSKSIMGLDESRNSQDSVSVYKLGSKIRDPKQIFNFNLNRNSLIPDKDDFNGKNMVEINKTNNFLDKVIFCVGDTASKQKIRKRSFSSSTDAKNYEDNLTKKLSSVEDKFTSFVFYSPNEKGENFILVEKRFSDNLKSENETLKIKLNTLKTQLSEAKENFNKLAGEATFMKQLNESQQKLKTENTKRSKILEKEIEETSKINEELKTVLTGRKLEKDDLERAISNYTKLYDAKFLEELKTLYKSYNNQYFMATYKPTDEKELQKMLGAITFLEKQISLKNNEINGLNKYLKVENKKIENERDEFTRKESNKNIKRANSKIK